jgi:hypothetical protein
MPRTHGPLARLTMVAVLCSLSVAAAMVGATVARAQRPAPEAAPPPSTASGILFGTILNELRVPVEGAEVSVEGTGMLTRADPAGRFLLEGVPAGLRELVVQAPGYRTARAQLTVVADSALELAVTLVSDGQRLPGVVVSAGISNRLMGLVVDEKDRPLAGVEVELIGVRRMVTTDDDGRFVFLDVRPGDWLLQIRKRGYRLQQRGIRMLPGIERDLAIRLHAGEDPRFSTALAVVVAREADRRQSMRGGRAVVVGRDELESWENAPLGVALLGSSGGMALREAGSACVLVDGHEVLRSSTGSAGLSTRRTMGRGPTSIQGAVTGGGGSPPPRPAVGSTTATVGNWLTFFRASDVELVEIFPEGADNSRTLCGRFPASSGCSCPPEPAGIVVWLKK